MKRYHTLEDVLAFKRGCDLKRVTPAYGIDAQPAVDMYSRAYDQGPAENSRSTKY